MVELQKSFKRDQNPTKSDLEKITLSAMPLARSRVPHTPASK